MGIETSDISDASILDATTVSQVGQGFQFSTTLPSGRAVSSEVVAAGDRARAGLIWVNTIKAEIVADSERAENDARRAARNNPRKRVDTSNVPTEGGVLPGEIYLGPDQPHTTSPVQAARPTPPRPLVGVPDMEDPNIFIITQRNMARSEYREAEMDLNSAKQRLAKARQAMAKWDAIYSSVVGDTGEHKVSNYQSVPVAGISGDSIVTFDRDTGHSSVEDDIDES